MVLGKDTKSLSYKINTNTQNLKLEIPFYSESLLDINSTSAPFIVGEYWKQPKYLIRRNCLGK